MYLKRLEISGFKSFASKISLELEPGITAIVGPNGSGKSNLADAIRWALGEQSSKPLRLKKSEDLVFAGTDKQPRASLAEVSLQFDNSDGALSIDYSEVELSRLLYRSGESEYKLNRNKIRLGEVQQLLIQAGFGPNSYAVIGQGTIDNFVISTPSERKLLFDEASGIRQYELKREQALRKLSATENNLTRVRDILSELEPRLKTLNRSVESVKHRQILESELKRLRSTLIATANDKFPAKIKQTDVEQTKLSQSIKQLLEAIKSLETDKDRATQAAKADLKHQHSLRNRLNALEIERDQLSDDISLKRAEMQLLLEIKPDTAEQTAQKRLQSTLNKLSSKLQATNKNLIIAESEQIEAQKLLEAAGREIANAQVRLNGLRREIDETSRHEFITHALTILKSLAKGLESGTFSNAETRLLIHKAGRLLSHASKGQSEVLSAIKQAQTELNNLMKRRETAHTQYTKVVIKVRSLELDIQHLTTQMSETEHQITELTDSSRKSNPNPKIIQNRRTELASLEQQLKVLQPIVDQLRSDLTAQPASSDTTEGIFALAADLESAKSSLVAAQRRNAELSAEKSEYENNLSHYQSLARTWFDQEEIVAAVSSQSIGDQEQSVRLLESKLESFAQVGEDVVQEHQEVLERYNFLSNQLNDLASAETDLRKLITRLEDLIKTKFDTAFSEISEGFGHYFAKLFGGGKAALQLKPDASGVYGIEIKAVPPGKRVESLAMLSGGERSLTGIALLAAILHVNPSPFVVMDEVDAALDEANSARFSQILEEIGRVSQLIVITHNRQTMQAANVLFGVTMDENQVSRLLSIKLEVAREFAAKK